MKPALKAESTTVIESTPKSQDEYRQLYSSTIMMVDDEPITMEVVQTFLEEAGYHNFVLIEESTEAMKAIELHCPDLLLLDLMMPEVSGFDILQAVRSHPKFKHLPIIILTSSSDNQDKLVALDLGATDFLAKPVDPSELRLRVRNTLAAKAYVDQLAYYDPLTQLPNRHLFMERLEWSMKWAKREGKTMALLSIELDQYDRISDMIGLFAGDEVLSQFADRIQKVIRSIDFLGHFEIDPEIDANLFRFEGGVFSLLLHRVRSERSAALVAERILDTIKKPILLEDTDTYITASIGIATYPAEQVESVTLLRLASSARDYAKNKGGDMFQFSSGEINTQYHNRLCLEAKLRKSLAKKELMLHYQPKVDVQTGTIKGVEALLRWNSGEDGLIFPDKFITIAEEIGLIVPIGEWVLGNACRQLKDWQQAGRQPITMSVNLSSLHFQEKELPSVVKRILDHSGLDPNMLILEVTESMLLDDIDSKIDLMKHLKDIGVKLSIDDFGTGYSSLNYLRRLPLDELKIDRSFVTDLGEDSTSRALFSSVVFLSHNLGLMTVAEGVEFEDQLSFLREHKCDQYQGFYFSPPLSSGEVFKLLPSKGKVEP